MSALLQRRWSVTVVALVGVAASAMFASRAPGRGEPRSPHGSRVCQTAKLSVRMGRSMAGLGHAGATLVFTNESSSTCEMHGWPRLISITAAARARRAEDVAGVSVGTALKGTPTVVLGPHRQAYAVFEGPDGSVSGRPCPPAFHVLKITPPGNRQSVSLSAWIPYLDAYLPSCGRIWISPIMAASSLGAVPAMRDGTHPPATVTRAPPGVLTARVIRPQSGELNLTRGTVLPAKDITAPREFRNARDGFALGGTLSATYPVLTVNGGATWRIAGPAFFTATADGALAVESIAVIGSKLDVAWGDTVIDVTDDGGRVWYQVFPQDLVVAVVAGFHGIAAYVQVTNTSGVVTDTVQYVSTDGGRRWTLSNALGG